MSARFSHIWQRVQRSAHTVADFQARLILSVLYLLFIVPVGFFVRVNDDPLEIGDSAQRASRSDQHAASGWRNRAASAEDLRSARRQF